jgi:hypothetical protein
MKYSPLSELHLHPHCDLLNRNNPVFPSHHPSIVYDLIIPFITPVGAGAMNFLVARFAHAFAYINTKEP